jgi:hypothetical protein
MVYTYFAGTVSNWYSNRMVMEPVRARDAATDGNRSLGSQWPRIVILGSLAIVVIGLLMPRTVRNSKSHANPAKSEPNSPGRFERHSATSSPRQRSAAATKMTPEEAVGSKLILFAHHRHDLVHAMAGKFNSEVPNDVERFFDAAESGHYEEMEALFQSLKELHADGDGHGLVPYWRAIVETAGAAEQAQAWPAQRLLDFGNAVLDSLRPGMVYLGGTDPGCFIPTFLNDTSEGEHHIVMTQNALADSSYLQYLSFLYGDQFANLTHENQEAALAAYLADYQERLAHDQQFPEEPKQVLDGESITYSNGYSQIFVMGVNDRLVETLLQKNPDLSFALEESYPLKSTYADASPIGPLMELRAPGGAQILTADIAEQSLAYWQNTVQQVLSDPAASSSDWTKAYAKMAEAQGNLFAANGLNDQAEQVFRLALQVNPSLSETVFGYVSLLQTENRLQDAIAVAQAAAQAAPENTQFGQLVSQLSKSSSAGK